MIRDAAITQLAQAAEDNISRVSSATLLGSEHAAIELYNIARFATDKLFFACRMKAAVFRAVAENKFSWPVMLNPHSESMKWTTRWLANLNLGSKTGINLSRAGKGFSYAMPANQIAIYLYELAHALKHAPIAEWSAEQRYLLPRQVSRASSTKASVATWDKNQIAALQQWGQEGAGSHLPALSKGTAVKWQAACRELLTLVFGNNLDQHPALQELMQDVRGSAKTAELKPGRAGEIRELMRKRVLQSLKSIAALD